MKENIRILVSDDEMSIRGVVASVLADDGYQVTTAQNGEEALNLFIPDPYHIVITDIVMGGMTGIDLLKQVKEINKDTQVIIMTSHASLDTAVEALRAGAYDYLVKPFDDIKIISIVAERAADRFNLILENKSLIEGLKKKNEELEKINRELSGMIGSISAPFSPGSISTSGSAFAGNADPNMTIHQNIEIIKRETTRCKTIIADLLSSKKTVFSEPTNIQVVIENVCAIIKHRFALNKVTLEKDISPDLPHALCSGNKLQNVIMNVMINAQQALSGAPGTVKISVRALSPQLLETRISDTGPGIPPEIQSRIFEPFFTTRPTGKGVGLGLSISLDIVKQYNGKISFESNGGRGTTFIITLPAAQAPDTLTRNGALAGTRR